ncbi:energy-coupling factor ABC transporter ATP-binding protein [Hydrogenophaga bisanensis]|uniref:Energy-coupling factor ABC transporter ATP-binding protein n=1 Tax=Hydrogenophaga bisanensis TaxID=439611 RepID=A0ABW2R4P7_9BURK
MAEFVLQFKEVSFSWDHDQPLLDRVSFGVQPGECVALVGRNGAGKSTLLKLASGLLKPAAGCVTLGDMDTAHTRAPKLARSVSLMFQEAERQISHDSIVDEVAFAPRMAGFDAAEVQRRVSRALNLAGLVGKANDHPLDLNGGERRMLTLASLIAQDTPLVLLDEPTRDFDAHLLDLFESWMKSALGAGTAIVFISHDLDFVARHAKRVLHMDGGEIAADGDVSSVLAHPDLQELSPMSAPTLPALCRALNVRATTRLEDFEHLWRERLHSEGWVLGQDVNQRV